MFFSSTKHSNQGFFITSPHALWGEKEKHPKFFSPGANRVNEGDRECVMLRQYCQEANQISPLARVWCLAMLTEMYFYKDSRRGFQLVFGMECYILYSCIHALPCQTKGAEKIEILNGFSTIKHHQNIQENTAKCDKGWQRGLMDWPREGNDQTWVP